MLCEQWFAGQLKDVPEDELPPKEEINRDMIEMRDEVFSRILPTLEAAECLSDGEPDDAANSKQLNRLVGEYEGLEATTPIFTKLALSKADQQDYQSGWPLCTIRLVAETYLKQSREA